MDLALAALALSIAVNAALAYAVHRSTPRAIVRDHALIRTEIERLHDQGEALQAKWAAAQVRLQELADEVGNYMESIEKKRRQTAASASKLARLQGQDGPDLSSQEGLWARARSMGLT